MKYAVFLLLLVTVLPAHAVGTWHFRSEVKANFRDSHDNRYPTAFPPGSAHETVNEGQHFEVSNIALMAGWQPVDQLLLSAKVDMVDLYERNPTSSDYKVSVDRWIIRYGTKHTQGLLAETPDFYIQVGKFGKFERQEDRHLESYGLVSTAFNRVEDSGIEAGFELPIGLYARLSYTTGNPVFIRDPNALAGDNGVIEANADDDIKHGISILYDAEVEDINLKRTPETGLGLGYRWISADGGNRINALLFGYEREMAEATRLNGTFYEADLDLLDVSDLSPNASLPVTHGKKKEYGANLWWYYHRFALFAQYVNQDVAGLERDGYELELSYAFDVPRFKYLIPAVRYSELNPDFEAGANYPSPSVTWDWQKWDIGLNLDINDDLRLTAEYAINHFQRNGKTEDNNELLMTLRWRYSL